MTKMYLHFINKIERKKSLDAKGKDSITSYLMIFSLKLLLASKYLHIFR